MRIPEPAPFPEMVWIHGGTFQMGSDHHYPEEAPSRVVSVGGFWIDRFEVTNIQFQRFVEATKYVTVAEREPNPKDYPDAPPEALVPGSLVFRKPPRPVAKEDWRQWWQYVPGACWRHPEGPGSQLKGRGKHPVVHVAYEDVEAYAAWAHKEIPTEAEWEFAARGGLDGAEYCWGDELTPGGIQMANTWQGQFPWENLAEDGFEGTSPVGSFPPNGYGLFDMAGNVWEWTSDLFSSSLDEPGASRRLRRVLKGGSHLCAPNYCRRYRPAARSPQELDSSACHLGFRLVRRTRA